MKQEPDRSSWPKKLLVEGNDDLHVVAHIRNNYQLDDNFEIVDCKSVDKVSKKLTSLFKSRNTDVIGIIVDADADTVNVEDALKARWDSICYILNKHGYTIPHYIHVNGTIIPATDRQPKIGIWIMPDNVQQPGMLEHFVATLIPADDRLKPVAEEVLDRLEAEAINGYKPIHRSKAIIHTWLAWQEDPGTPMGLAITKTYLNHNTELCDRFAKWLSELFN